LKRGITGASMHGMSVNDLRTFDALPPPDIARRAEAAGEAKAALSAATMFALAIPTDRVDPETVARPELANVVEQIVQQHLRRKHR